jgi:hypothetical protein
VGRTGDGGALLVVRFARDRRGDVILARPFPRPAKMSRNSIASPTENLGPFYPIPSKNCSKYFRIWIDPCRSTGSSRDLPLPYTGYNAHTNHQQMVSSMLRVPLSSRLSGAARSLPVHRLARPISIRWFVQTAIARKKAEQNGQDEGTQSNKRRTSPGKNSLRRVSIEAERSRLVINKAGRKFIDPDADTKACGLIVHYKC